MNILLQSSTVIILSIAKHLGYRDISQLNVINKYLNKVLAMFPFDLSSKSMYALFLKST